MSANVVVYYWLSANYTVMSYRRKYPRQFVAWSCQSCGSKGITGGKDEVNLIRSIWRHHHAKNRCCRFHRKSVKVHDYHPRTVVKSFNPLGFAVIRIKRHRGRAD